MLNPSSFCLIWIQTGLDESAFWPNGFLSIWAYSSDFHQTVSGCIRIDKKHNNILYFIKIKPQKCCQKVYRLNGSTTLEAQAIAHSRPLQQHMFKVAHSCSPGRANSISFPEKCSNRVERQSKPVALARPEFPAVLQFIRSSRPPLLGTIRG